MKVGDMVRVHYDNSVGTVTRIEWVGGVTLYTVVGTALPHRITPNQLNSELTLIHGWRQHEAE